jgi:hypothetical protein
VLTVWSFQATEYDSCRLAKYHTALRALRSFQMSGTPARSDFAANARSPRPSPRSLCEPCEPCMPHWRRRPAQPHRRPAHPIDRLLCPKAAAGVGWRIDHRLRRGTRRRSRRDYHSCACVRSCSLTICGNGRPNSSSVINGLELYPGRHSRVGGVGLTPLVEAAFWCCLRGWRPAEVRKALGGKHARRSNTQSVRRAPAPPLRVRLDMTRVL